MGTVPGVSSNAFFGAPPAVAPVEQLTAGGSCMGCGKLRHGARDIAYELQFGSRGNADDYSPVQLQYERKQILTGAAATSNPGGAVRDQATVYNDSSSSSKWCRREPERLHPWWCARSGGFGAAAAGLSSESSECAGRRENSRPSMVDRGRDPTALWNQSLRVRLVQRFAGVFCDRAGGRTGQSLCQRHAGIYSQLQSLKSSSVRRILSPEGSETSVMIIVGSHSPQPAGRPALRTETGGQTRPTSPDLPGPPAPPPPRSPTPPPIPVPALAPLRAPPADYPI